MVSVSYKTENDETTQDRLTEFNVALQNKTKIIWAFNVHLLLNIWQMFESLKAEAEHDRSLVLDAKNGTRTEGQAMLVEHGGGV